MQFYQKLHIFICHVNLMGIKVLKNSKPHMWSKPFMIHVKNFSWHLVNFIYAEFKCIVKNHLNIFPLTYRIIISKKLLLWALCIYDNYNINYNLIIPKTSSKYWTKKLFWNCVNVISKTKPIMFIEKLQKISSKPVPFTLRDRYEIYKR